MAEKKFFSAGRIISLAIIQLWYDRGGSSSGIFGWSDLYLTGSSELPTWMPNSYPAWSIPYSYNLDPPEDTKSIVMAGARSS